MEIHLKELAMSFNALNLYSLLYNYENYQILVTIGVFYFINYILFIIIHGFFLDPLNFFCYIRDKCISSSIICACSLWKVYP